MIPAEMGSWFRCSACGSDTSTNEYNPKLYNQDHAEYHLKAAGGYDGQALQLTTNMDLFDRHESPGKDFLDIGCCEGVALSEMQRRGWSVHGFDVFRPSYYGDHVTVAPHFSRWLFPRRYDAILCREVIEHIPCPNQFIREIHGALNPGGLLQLQTPRPQSQFHGIPYQSAHLHLASPTQFRAMLERSHFTILETLMWELGQVAICRANG
jgi:2-polyprenyl-3-methyl-5-hydroxy-6-metoxy-1,4-benzoquinol methylase